MGALANYAGLIEVALTFGGVTAFVIWQMRELNRDVAAREALEAKEREKANAGSDAKP